MALISKLENIADAIREKTGKEDKLTLDEMAVEIAAIETGGGGGADIPEEAFKFTEDCASMFANNKWGWFLDTYRNKITTEGITNSNNMFYNSTNLTELPFDFNFNNSTNRTYGSMFYGCNQLKKIGKIINPYPNNMQYMFYQCWNLRELPEFVNLNMSRVYSYAYANIGSMFNGCYSLRRIPEDLLKQFYNPLATNGNYTALGNGFSDCFALDEIRGLNPQTGALTNNIFSYSFERLNRVKDIIFATQEDGTPYSVNWKNQTINLTKDIGYITYARDKALENLDDAAKLSASANIVNYNSGITVDKAIHNDATYAALKDDPDAYCIANSLAALANYSYSRYNHDSAVNTINSLPSTSGTGCSIKFLGAAGSKTDGGAINTLTEEEIAVAAAKGWTVTLV